MDKKETLPNPLPTRFKEVKQFREMILSGVVVVPSTLEERYDVANAAQSVVIDKVLSELMIGWRDIELNCVDEENFFQCFASAYFDEVLIRERQIWQKHLDATLVTGNLDLNNLSALEAATLTLANMPEYHEMVATSQELFVEAAMHAEVYEKLLRDKYKDVFQTIFIRGIQDGFPGLMKRLIALDSVIIDFYRMNVSETPLMNDGRREYGQLGTRYFGLDDNDQLVIRPETLQVFKKAALERGVKNDSLGRDANRGCPFLVSGIREEFVTFAIHELIAQYKKSLLRGSPVSVNP